MEDIVGVVDLVVVASVVVCGIVVVVVDDTRIQLPFWQVPPGQLVPLARAAPDVQIELTQMLGLWHVMFWQTVY